jgi:hypothetical protein
MLAETKSQTLVAEGPIADALRSQLGLDDDVLRKLDVIDNGDVLGISGEVIIEISVRNGRGEWNSPTIPTFWATVRGTVKILEPQGDSWYVKVRDTIAEKTVFEGTLRPGQEVPYNYKTGFRTQLQATVACGRPVNTTLKVRATYDF